MSNSTISIDRRSSLRISSPLRSKFRVLDRVTHKRLSGWKHSIVDNISTGGVDILINELTGEEIGRIKDPDNIFEIKIYFPAGRGQIMTKGDLDFISKLGKAVWECSSEYYFEVGLKFLDIEAGSEEIIKNFISSESLKH